MRQPEDITHNGKTLRAILDDHALLRRGEGGQRADLRWANLRGADLRWADLIEADLSEANLRGANLRGAFLRWAKLRWANLRGADMRRADLSGADLSGSDLSEANLSGASLWDTIGNMREVKSAQFDRWPLAWVTAPDGEVTLQIGCKRHPLETWRNADDDWIADLDPDALVWWRKYRDAVLALVDASPAVPYGVVNK